MSNYNIDKIIRDKTFVLRGKKCNIENPFVPRFVESDYYKINDCIYKRLRIILAGNGCSVPMCTMCPFPNESINPSYIKFTADHYIDQISRTLEKYPSHDVVSIYNDGSFFADNELQEEARIKIYKLIKDYRCKYLMVESLPFFITEKKVAEAKRYLEDKIKLIVGIGLQSSSDEIRQICIRTPVNKEDFLQAYELLKSFNYDTKSYVLIKPPFVLEDEAIDDVVKSACWLHHHGVEDVTLCPMRIAEGTILYELYSLGLYSAPKLTTVAECLHRLKLLNLYTRVSIFNVSSSDLEALTSSGCSLCQDKILSGILDHNNLIDINFNDLLCKNCHEESKKNGENIFYGLSYNERIKIWLRKSDAIN